MECAHCGATFGSDETLQRHVAAIHASAAGDDEGSAAESDDDGEEEAEGEGEEDTNLELAPLLTVLSDEQKELLLLRAIQHAPEVGVMMLTVAKSNLTRLTTIRCRYSWSI